MKKHLCIALLLLLPLFSAAQIERPIGTNLNGVTDWSREIVFTNIFKQSREWVSFNADGTGDWSTNVEIPLNENGYPLQIPYDNGVDPPQCVRTLVLTSLGDATPIGRYRLIVSGTGKVRLRFGAEATFDCPVDTYVDIDDNVTIRIEESDVNDPITDIKLILPDYTETYQSKTFTDEFLTFLKDFQVLRFMDWTETNFSDVEHWSERGKYNYYTQAQEVGVAWEYVIDLCNTAQKDAWINIPHLADLEYIRQLANLFHDQLNTGLKLYIEYSNEVWNGAFVQHQEAAALASGLGYTGQEWERAWKYTAKRSADIFSIFETVFTDDSRLVKVIPSQAANSWLSNQIITYFKDPTYNPEQVSADALAIAPYFGGSVANEIVDEGLVGTITIEEIVDRMEAQLATSFEWMDENLTVANNHSYGLITYEGGQHLVATGNNMNIEELTEKLTAANRHPDLQDVYCQYFNYWYQNIGGLFVHFSSHGAYSKYGSWGVKEYMGDVNNPKYLALKNCVFSHNSTNTGINKSPSKLDWEVFPTDLQKGRFVLHGSFKDPTINLYDLAGKQMAFDLKQSSKREYVLVINQPGIFILSVKDGDLFRSFKITK